MATVLLEGIPGLNEPQMWHIPHPTTLLHLAGTVYACHTVLTNGPHGDETIWLYKPAPTQ